MKAAFVCDFYMTKYHAKAQQLLASALPWVTQGIRRCEAEEVAEDEPEPVPDRAFKRLQRIRSARRNLKWSHDPQFEGDEALKPSRGKKRKGRGARSRSPSPPAAQQQQAALGDREQQAGFSDGKAKDAEELHSKIE